MCRTFIRQNNACISILMVACIVKQMPAIIVTQFRFLCNLCPVLLKLRDGQIASVQIFMTNHILLIVSKLQISIQITPKRFFGKMKRWNSWRLRYTETNLLFNTLPCFIEKEKLKFRNNPLIVCILTSIEFVAEHC